MARILAIEPDPERSVRLQRLVSEHLNAEVVLTASADDALLTLTAVPPDVILTSSLLPRSDDEQLAAHLRSAPDLDHLPVLVIPPLEEQPSRVEPKRVWWSLLSLRRQPQAAPAYDFIAIVKSIEAALERSKSDAPESEIERPARLMLLEARGMRLLKPGNAQECTGLIRLDEPLPSARTLEQWRARARRWNSHELPWLSAVTLPWGAGLRLLNISSTGLLVESDFYFTPGNKTRFRLAGANHQELIVPGSVVRAEPSGEGELGDRYIVAAVFDRPFDSLGPVRSLEELRRFTN
jgi:CheY-like chemotaxis protein